METAGSDPGEPSPLEAPASADDRLFLIKGMVALRWSGMFSNSFRPESPLWGFTLNSACRAHTSLTRWSLLGRGGQIWFPVHAVFTHPLYRFSLHPALFWWPLSLLPVEQLRAAVLEGGRRENTHSQLWRTVLQSVPQEPEVVGSRRFSQEPLSLDVSNFECNYKSTWDLLVQIFLVWTLFLIPSPNSWQVEFSSVLQQQREC